MLSELETKIDKDFEDCLLGRRNVLELKVLYEKEVDRLDEFFNLYTNKIELDPAITDTTEWNFYNKKYKEYEIYADALNRVDCYTKNIQDGY